MIELKTWLEEASKSLDYQECIYIARAVLSKRNLKNDELLTKLSKYCLDFALEARKNNIPLAKIVQKKDFMDHWFMTNDYTLDPRPETEALIEHISIKPRTILDLGTGTGCIIISLLKKFPKAKGTAIDISKEAIKIATENSKIWELEKRLKIFENNWANDIEEHFDLIVCNPPYVDPSAAISKETKQDPSLALFGSEETYKDVFQSLEKIDFYEFLLEIPENLIEKTKPMINLIKHKSYEFIPIYNSGIFVLKIEREKNF